MATAWQWTKLLIGFVIVAIIGIRFAAEIAHFIVMVAGAITTFFVTLFTGLTGMLR
ncbi:hypothetical protein [Amycolatopsis sp.]|uniref:hypothetical protein n=1 Tax=Amycolatopsis sp. TaxID=37632 RepID=UPI002D7FA721|nr:hypothetical protein [Amycolatopsis sp.]HET6711327.1 hypothetical protein [Amycolatopsis sp.]